MNSRQLIETACVCISPVSLHFEVHLLLPGRFQQTFHGSGILRAGYRDQMRQQLSLLKNITYVSALMFHLQKANVLDLRDLRHSKDSSTLGLGETNTHHAK